MAAEIVFGMVMLVIAIGLYMLPTIIASLRKKKNAGAIMALNFFLGWTMIGWVVSLVWALTAEGK